MCKGLATLPATCLKSAKDIKHKINIFLQRQESQEVDQKQTDEKNEEAAKRVPTAAEVEKWKESFSFVINCEIGRNVFTSFLRSEFSQENMQFWVACEDFKNTSICKLEKKAKFIYQQYVAIDSPNEVNLDAGTREETRQKVMSASHSCFDEAQRRIYILMEKDSYRRFLHSKLIHDLSQAHTSVVRKKQNSGYSTTDIREEFARVA
ncbi:regulator of G-protein signaling 4-like isoform X1 [Phyllopteryx taeniolatus]|uniref:regulator of G-protein signaling 4-like isoform X1 n=1 Tax=Phyllopteryx taeniolatus TaxID=161469 RepID=UPI002AD5887B|nr:regulator of G-protein signaling 4-like isoform X1 [Phyllopteryx taeniolatus]